MTSHADHLTDAGPARTNNLTVVSAEQGVHAKKTPRILVVEASADLEWHLKQQYKQHPEQFHGCELVFAHSIDPKKNAEFVLYKHSGIDGVVTGLSHKQDHYGIMLAALLKKAGFKGPVAINGLTTDSPEIQRLAKEAGALETKDAQGNSSHVFDKTDTNIYAYVRDAITPRTHMRSVQK